MSTQTRASPFYHLPSQFHVCPATLFQSHLLRMPIEVCMVCLVISSRGPTSLGDMDVERGPVINETNLEIVIFVER